MDGVLWRGTSPIGVLSKIFQMIKTKGLNFIMVTNNATRSPLQYVTKLAELGVQVESWQILNSAVATASYLKNRFPANNLIFSSSVNLLRRSLTRSSIDSF